MEGSLARDVVASALAISTAAGLLEEVTTVLPWLMIGSGNDGGKEEAIGAKRWWWGRGDGCGCPSPPSPRLSSADDHMEG